MHIRILCMIFYLVFSTGFRLPAQLPFLKVSDNKRFIVTTDGKPFFWMGDTGWELFHRLNRADTEMYFKKRSEQGFNVIQAVALAELNGLHVPNANGDTPLLRDDPNNPNEKYFLYVDSIIGLAAQYHLYIALLPTWGDKVFKNKWGIGPEIFNPTNAYNYGKWIGNRYKDRTNIIWIIGGDRSPRDSSADLFIWRAMARGVTEGVGGPDKALMSFHTQPDGLSSSSEWFQADSWLDFNMLQTGHCRDTPVWEMVSHDYSGNPVKPVVNGESIYEEMPVCFNAQEWGYSNAYDVRKAAYLSVFSGAFGHTYGCGPVIWFSQKGDNIFSALHSWNEALDFPAANEMKYLRTLMESVNMLDRIPDQSLLVNQITAASERIQVTRGKDYVFVYSAYGKPVVVKMQKLTGNSIQASWYDPRTGILISIGNYINSGQQTFTPPVPAGSPVPSQREDWVLILKTSAKGKP